MHRRSPKADPSPRLLRPRLRQARLRRLPGPLRLLLGLVNVEACFVTLCKAEMTSGTLCHIRRQRERRLGRQPGARSTSSLAPCPLATRALLQGGPLPLLPEGPIRSSGHAFPALCDKVYSFRGYEKNIRAPSSPDSHAALLTKWTEFHVAWFGPQGPPWLPAAAKVRAVMATFKCGGYASAMNYVPLRSALQVQRLWLHRAPACRALSAAGQAGLPQRIGAGQADPLSTCPPVPWAAVE